MSHLRSVDQATRDSASLELDREVQVLASIPPLCVMWYVFLSCHVDDVAFNVSFIH